MVFNVLEFICLLASIAILLMRAACGGEEFLEFLATERENTEGVRMDGDFLIKNFKFKSQLASMSCNAILYIIVLGLIMLDPY